MNSARRRFVIRRIADMGLLIGMVVLVRIVLQQGSPMVASASTYDRLVQRYSVVSAELDVATIAQEYADVAVGALCKERDTLRAYLISLSDDLSREAILNGRAVLMRQQTASGAISTLVMCNKVDEIAEGNPFIRFHSSSNGLNQSWVIPLPFKENREYWFVRARVDILDKLIADKAHSDQTLASD